MAKGSRFPHGEDAKVREMRTAETILNIIQDRGKRKLPLDDVYRQLYNPDIYLRSYAKLYPNDGAMTPGITEETVDGWSMEKVAAIIVAIRDERWQWTPVKRVLIDKPKGGKRPLGLPVWLDKVVQDIIRSILEAYYEPQFSKHSHGFRPKRGCHTALKEIDEVWQGTKWFIEGDIKGCFDNIDHALLLRALRKHTACPWVLLYVARWLQAPVQGQDGTLIQRGQGVPQGGCISPVLANLFLHYAFDAWMQREHPSIPFERYADDIIAHCQSEAQARWLQARIATRLAQCHLELHPTKTHIVYCKDADRRGTFPQERFDFLGYTFRPRRSKNRRGKYFINFTPAVSARATKAIRQTIRSWRLHLRSNKTLDDLARMFNPILRGWVQYYGQYYKSALYPTFRVLDRILVKWAMRKYKKLKGHQRRATHWLGRIAQRQPRLFVHWQMGVRPAAGR